VHAASNVTLKVRRGETLGVVGESGSGKSTVARCISRLIDPTGGAILIDGADIARLPARSLRSSTHAFGVSDAVELARALGRLPGRLDVYAIEGASFTAGDRLSPDVERAVDELATALTSERR